MFAQMLSGLTKSFRIKAAIFVAVLYAFCVLAPAAVLAFADAATAVHCLTEQHGTAKPHDHGKAHMHGDGTVHHHGDDGAAAKHSDSDKQGHAANCCGVFCMSGLAAEPIAALGDPLHFSLLIPATSSDLASRGPDRINRPPIA